MRLTDEQKAVITAFAASDDQAVTAGAGTGKTSTLRACAASQRELTGLYVTYSRALANEARRAFRGLPVKVATAHSLAWKQTPGSFRQRATATGRVPYRKIASHLGLPGRSVMAGGRKLTASALAWMTRQTVGRWNLSMDSQVGPQHLEARYRNTEVEPLLLEAATVWARDLADPHGVLPYTHDDYLAAWARTRPQLDADYVMLDEAQDADPAIASVFACQQIPRIAVGDTCQAIYSWRGAVNAMSMMNGAVELPLSESFRFGPAVADVANRYLSALGSSLTLSGVGPQSLVLRSSRLDGVDAILTRSNVGAVEVAIESMNAGRSVHMVGGASDVSSLVEAGWRMAQGMHARHRAFAGFDAWQNVVDYALTDPDPGDLGIVVRLDRKFGLPRVVEALSHLVDATSADVVVSTAHKAKGRQWDRVAVAHDFPPVHLNADGRVCEADREEAMLAYVTATRARTELRDAGLVLTNAKRGISDERRRTAPELQ